VSWITAPTISCPPWPRATAAKLSPCPTKALRGLLPNGEEASSPGSSCGFHEDLDRDVLPIPVACPPGSRGRHPVPDPDRLRGHFAHRGHRPGDLQRQAAE